MSEDTKLLKQMLDELKEMRTWLRLSVFSSFRRTISDNVRDDIDKLVYEFSDGSRSTREIVSELSKQGKAITHVTVANMWKRWAVVGIVEPSERYQGRFRKITSLESIGIDVPKMHKEGEQKNVNG